MIERITTEAPESNMGNMYNRFYINSDKWVMVRNGGVEPEYPNVSLCNYIRRLATAHNAEINVNGDDFDLCDELDDYLLDGPESIEGLIAEYNAAAIAAAALREKLKKYEDEEEAGRLLHLPYKFGETVYTFDFFGKVKKCKLYRVDYESGDQATFYFKDEQEVCYPIMEFDLKKRIFRTEEEAEHSPLKKARG